MPKKTKKQSIWIIVAVIAAAAGLAGWFWIWPSLQYINETTALVQEQKGEIEQLEQQKGAAIKEDIEQYDDITQKLESNQATEENLIKVIENIENIAGQSGAEYELSVSGEESTSSARTTASTASQPDQKNPDQKQAEPEEVKLQLKLTGNFDQLFNTLKKIENLPTVISVSGIEFDESVTLSESLDENEPTIASTATKANYTLTIPLSK